MNLNETLAGNPEAVAAFNEAIATARAEGETAANEKMAKTIAAVTPYLSSKDYPAVIAETALKVLKGEESEVTLKAAVAAVDAVIEKKKDDEAKGEQGDETPPQSVDNAAEKYNEKKARLANMGV